MFHLVGKWSITPKDGVAEKFDVNHNKKWNIFFGILEFSNAYMLIKMVINLFKSFSKGAETNPNIPLLFKVLPYLELILIISIFVTGILYFCNKLIAYKIYFVQFFFRLLFFIPSFGLLLKLRVFISNSVFMNVMNVVCVILEVCRFVVTIFIVHESRRYV